MARRPCSFRQGDVTKALRAASAAGAQVQRIEIAPDGRIVMEMGEPDASGTAANPWLAELGKTEQ
jgi:hypothetical protein